MVHTSHPRELVCHVNCWGILALHTQRRTETRLDNNINNNNTLLVQQQQIDEIREAQEEMQEMAVGLQRKNAILRNELRHLKRELEGDNPGEANMVLSRDQGHNSNNSNAHSVGNGRCRVNGCCYFVLVLVTEGTEWRYWRCCRCWRWYSQWHGDEKKKRPSDLRMNLRSLTL